MMDKRTAGARAGYLVCSNHVRRELGLLSVERWKERWKDGRGSGRERFLSRSVMLASCCCRPCMLGMLSTPLLALLRALEETVSFDSAALIGPFREPDFPALCWCANGHGMFSLAARFREVSSAAKKNDAENHRYHEKCQSLRAAEGDESIENHQKSARLSAICLWRLFALTYIRGFTRSINRLHERHNAAFEARTRTRAEGPALASV
ncbi:hypothetical protein BCR44DRAFT_1247717 [Catenaria anguillulae PL171]|uniref:Uncharacterized protein n=1 Tax=Catenaria anguillulae PL171 TaxID=765915 RepID=A0A1Y2HY60_9FUNG|nr:hypothetical protein BCR44DRAFT_1247717 [Catenaria anguillulae PL171]